MGGDEATKEYWSQWDLLALKEGVLHRQWVAGDGHPRWFQLIQAVGLRLELIKRAKHGLRMGTLASERRKIRFNAERFGRDGVRIYIGSVEVVLLSLIL